MMGRQLGKSTLSKKAFQRLWNDLHPTPVSKMKLSEKKWHGARYYCVEPVGGSWLDMETWAVNTYGAPSDVWSAETGNWYMNNSTFWFRNEHDRTMFVLRWR